MGTAVAKSKTRHLDYAYRGFELQPDVAELLQSIARGYTGVVVGLAIEVFADWWLNRPSGYVIEPEPRRRPPYRRIGISFDPASADKLRELADEVGYSQVGLLERIIRGLGDGTDGGAEGSGGKYARIWRLVSSLHKVDHPPSPDAVDPPTSIDRVRAATTAVVALHNLSGPRRPPKKSLKRGRRATQTAGR